MVSPSRLTARVLPELTRHVQMLAYVALRLPEHAAREMTLAVQFDARRQVDPYGNPWAPVREGGRFRKHDPLNHVRDSYFPAVRGDDAIVASEHRAAAALQPKDPAKRRYRRLRHPIEGEGLGSWDKRIARMHRRLFVGARMGEAKREELKQAAAARKAARLARRNAERIALGKKPLKPRKVRSDRARVDALVLRAL